VSWAPQQAGSNEIHVLVGTRPVQGSPFTVTCQPGNPRNVEALPRNVLARPSPHRVGESCQSGPMPAQNATIFAGATDPSTCIVSGRAVHLATAGAMCNFVITARDRTGSDVAKVIILCLPSPPLSMRSFIFSPIHSLLWSRTLSGCPLFPPPRGALLAVLVESVAIFGIIAGR
jgi:hypothetical protein